MPEFKKVYDSILKKWEEKQANTYDRFLVCTSHDYDGHALFRRT